MDRDSEGVSETGNWNVAGNFVQEKIMRFLSDADKYEIIARFGVGEMLENFITTDEQRVAARIAALDWLYASLIMLINNTRFAIRPKDDKTMMEELKTALLSIEPHFKNISYSIYNQRTKKTRTIINEQKFKMILDTLVEIKQKINFPLNRSHLIFHYEEEFNPSDYKSSIKEKLKRTG